jgi:hypothetical protein
LNAAESAKLLAQWFDQAPVEKADAVDVEVVPSGPADNS